MKRPPPSQAVVHTANPASCSSNFAERFISKPPIDNPHKQSKLPVAGQRSEGRPALEHGGVRYASAMTGTFPVLGLFLRTLLGKGSPMLVLTRKSGEEIVVGNDTRIRFQIIQVGHNKVKVGVVAPEDVPITRRELLKRPPWCNAGDSEECLGVVLKRPTRQQLDHCAECPRCDPEKLAAAAGIEPASSG